MAQTMKLLELLSDADRLHGFSVHFSNGARATNTRAETGVECTNILFEPDGSINFMVGLFYDGAIDSGMESEWTTILDRQRNPWCR